MLFAEQLKKLFSMLSNELFAELFKTEICKDKDFKPCKLADIKDEELQLFLSRLYDKD